MLFDLAHLDMLDQAGFGNAMAVIKVDVLETDGATILVEIGTSAGLVQILCEWELITRRLKLSRVHIQGLHPGALGRDGLNAIAQKMMEEADADTLEIRGEKRTTGRNQGRPPKPFFARRQIRSET